MKKFLLVNFTTHAEGAKEVPYLWLTLRSYFQRNSINPSAWEWLDPIHDDYAESPEQIINHIVEQSPDVIGISCYMWNDKLTLHIAEEVKRKLPNIKIIAGGPALYYERDKSWFVSHWYIDVVCEYAGYGEVFITDYLDGKDIKSIPFAVYPALRRAFWNKSTVEINRREFKYPLPYKDNVEYLKRFKQKYQNIKVILDTSRGCPYSCSFCEWGGGTSTKVVFKPREEVFEELRIIFETLQPFYIDIINANFGVIKDDVLVAANICTLHTEYKCVESVTLYGPTKSNKKNLKEIFDLFLQHGIHDSLKLSIQSTTQEVLDNINRIDMSYDKQIELYGELSNKYNIPLRFETMIGLPGETKESFYDMVGKLTQSDLLYPLIHEWQMLPSAPAADPEYSTKMEIKTKKVIYHHDGYDNHIKSKSSVINVDKGIRHLLEDQKYLAPYDIVVSTYSYSVEDWTELELFKYYYTFLNATRILTPIQKYLQSLNVYMKEFNRSLFNDFLTKIPMVNKAYKDFIECIKNDEPSDIFYADLAPNLPYISHYSTLKFLILLNPNGFFSALSLWLKSKYGDDKTFDMICEQLADNIKTPMKMQLDPKEAVAQTLAMCKYWRGELFLDDFRSEY